MTEREFINRAGLPDNGGAGCRSQSGGFGTGQVSKDIIQYLLDVLNELKIDYCVIGGLAVSAYAEPVISLDIDIVIVAKEIDKLVKTLEKDFKIEKFPHSINFNSSLSNFRIQLQTDPRYEAFLKHSSVKKVMGYEMKVADIKDVLQGKVWAYSDEQRRKSKRQKDLADILRLIEKYPHLQDLLPESIKNILS